MSYNQSYPQSDENNPDRRNVNNIYLSQTGSVPSRTSSPLPPVPSRPIMDEFGGGYSYNNANTGSGSRRPLPVQPPTLPPNPYPSTATGQPRRSLPTPPAGPRGPVPPPRPTSRALPSLPPSPIPPTTSSPTPPPPIPKVNSPLPLSNPNQPNPPSRPLPELGAHVQKQQSSSSLSRNIADRIQAQDLHESPKSLAPSTPEYFPSQPGSGRTPSLAHSTSTSSGFSNAQGLSRLPSINSSETDATRFSGLENWLPHMGSLDEGTNITIKSPEGDGRRTPTLENWNNAQGYLGVEPRLRTTSASTVGAMDAGLPSMPSFVVERALAHQRSYGALASVASVSGDGYGGSSSSTTTPNSKTERVLAHQASYSALGNSRVEFPTPQVAEGLSRRASAGSQHTEYNIEEPPLSNSSPRRQPSTTTASSIHPSIASHIRRRSSALSPSWASQSQPPTHWVERKLQIHQSHADDYYEDEDGSVRRRSDAFEEEDGYDDEVWEGGEEEEIEEVNEIRFFQPAFLSEAALQLRDRVERRRQTKAGIAWVGSFTGRDIVTTIQGFLPAYTRGNPADRRFALITAQSLQNQLWFVEVDWDIKPLRDSSEDVFRFMGEMDGMGAGEGLTTDLPSGLMTMATRCYSPSCSGDGKCYVPRCPYKTSPSSFLGVGRPQATPAPTASTSTKADWTEQVDPLILRGLSPEAFKRQTIIRQALASEVAYESDLLALQKLFIEDLRRADPPVFPSRHLLEVFISECFGNIGEVLEACRRLIDSFKIRERESEQMPLILSVGDLFLQAAADFRGIYPDYTGNLPQAENVLKRELEENAPFRLFCERVVRENDRRRDIKYLITRPSTQLQRYPAVLEAILNATSYEDPDRDFLVEALSSIQNLSAISQLKLFHASKGKGVAGKMQWFDLVPEDQRKNIEKKEQKRQMQIWELIQGEMEYVADLEVIDQLFVNGLRIAEKGIVIERTRLETFLDEAFHNYRSLLEVHTHLLENLQHRQLEQHPHFGMISDLILDAALNWQDAYMEYVTHYPIAKAKVQEEEIRNPKFAAFLKDCLKDPSSHRQDIYHFINRPIPRLLRYNLLLADILKSLKDVGPENHPDIETIPQVMELIGDLGKATQKGVAVNESKVELWTFQHSLDGQKFGPRVVKDLDLTNSMRELIGKGRVFRQPEGTISTAWAELLVLLFDNYLVLAKPEKYKSSRREDRQVRYIINRRPIPLELLSLINFSDAPRQRPNRTLFSGGNTSLDPEPSNNDASDARTVYPFTISFIGQGQLGGQYTLWTDSYAARADWQEKLLHAKVLRAEVNDANKVFEMTPLSLDTFFVAPNYAVKVEGDSTWTGRVTCSVPFTTVDGRLLVAVGCEEGVWIGLRNEPRSLRKVLHVKSVMNIAVLEEFGSFLVLQDKSLLAYHLEALVPSASSPQVRAAPQRLSPGKDIVFFAVGQLSGRTLVLYMKKRGMDSLFRVLEPIMGRNAEDNRQRRPFGNLLGQRTEWFRLYKDFFIPTEAVNVHFLKHKLAVVCSKGFEIMDLTDLKGGSIPIFDAGKVRDRPALAEVQRKCDAGKPLGMFRSTETEFLLIYDSFGLYVDRHGEPNRDCQVIEWEGRPDSVAFHPPYLLLISAPFIEIRHIDNAKLLQIYTGSDIRLTWDGTGGMARPFIDNPGPNGYGDETSSQEPRIHICHRPDEVRKTRGAPQAVGQHVFELTPTLALNNPLLNPVHTHDSNYFPPAPPLSTRPSSMMTTSTATDYYAAVGNGHPHPARSDASWG